MQVQTWKVTGRFWNLIMLNSSLVIFLLVLKLADNTHKPGYLVVLIFNTIQVVYLTVFKHEAISLIVTETSSVPKWFCVVWNKMETISTIFKGLLLTQICKNKGIVFCISKFRRNDILSLIMNRNKTAISVQDRFTFCFIFYFGVSFRFPVLF